jgi:hypothetical protein
LNDFVRRRHPGQVNPNVRLMVATKSSVCEVCGFKIVAYRSRIGLAFASKTWVHQSCLPKVPQT